MEIDSPLTSLATSSPGSPSSPHSLPRSAPSPTPADIRPSPLPLQLDQTPAEHLATLDTHKQNPLATLGAETGGYEDELDYNDVADLYVGIGLSSEEDGEAETRVMDGFEELEEGELQGSSTTESTSEERDVAPEAEERKREREDTSSVEIIEPSSASSVQQPSTATLASSSSIDAREVNSLEDAFFDQQSFQRPSPHAEDAPPPASRSTSNHYPITPPNANPPASAADVGRHWQLPSLALYAEYLPRDEIPPYRVLHSYSVNLVNRKVGSSLIGTRGCVVKRIIGFAGLADLSILFDPSPQAVLLGTDGAIRRALQVIEEHVYGANVWFRLWPNERNNLEDRSWISFNREKLSEMKGWKLEERYSEDAWDFQEQSRLRAFAQGATGDDGLGAPFQRFASSSFSGRREDDRWADPKSRRIGVKQPSWAPEGYGEEGRKGRRWGVQQEASQDKADSVEDAALARPSHSRSPSRILHRSPSPYDEVRHSPSPEDYSRRSPSPPLNRTSRRWSGSSRSCSRSPPRSNGRRRSPSCSPPLSSVYDELDGSAAPPSAKEIRRPSSYALDLPSSSILHFLPNSSHLVFIQQLHSCNLSISTRSCSSSSTIELTIAFVDDGVGKGLDEELSRLEEVLEHVARVVGTVENGWKATGVRIGDAPPASTANNQDRRRSSTSHSRSYSTSPPELSYSHSPSSLEDSPPLQSLAESRHPGRGNGSYGKERVEERRGSRAAAASSTEAAWERGRYGSETGRKSFAKQVSYEELSRGQERRGRGERDDDKSYHDRSHRCQHSTHRPPPQAQPPAPPRRSSSRRSRSPPSRRRRSPSPPPKSRYDDRWTAPREPRCDDQFERREIGRGGGQGNGRDGRRDGKAGGGGRFGFGRGRGK